MTDFDTNFSFQERFFPAVARLVGPHLIRPADIEMDRKQATDYLNLKAADMRIAARVRRPEYSSFHREFTIRSYCHGFRTEWDKVIEDEMGDWMFYGHATGKGIEVNPWFLIDLDVLRGLYEDYGDQVIKIKDKPNGDGTRFHVFEPGYLLRTFGRPIVVAWSFGGKVDAQTQLFQGAA